MMLSGRSKKSTPKSMRQLRKMSPRFRANFLTKRNLPALISSRTLISSLMRIGHWRLRKSTLISVKEQKVMFKSFKNKRMLRRLHLLQYRSQAQALRVQVQRTQAQRVQAPRVQVQRVQVRTIRRVPRTLRTRWTLWTKAMINLKKKRRPILRLKRLGSRLSSKPSKLKSKPRRKPSMPKRKQRKPKRNLKKKPRKPRKKPTEELGDSDVKERNSRNTTRKNLRSVSIKKSSTANKKNSRKLSSVFKKRSKCASRKSTSMPLQILKRYQLLMSSERLCEFSW